ncbi:689_t:CDS:2, partial [Dentiscutata erythropus]
DFKNCIVSNRGGATTCPTNQKESNIVERKVNLYISTKANENKTSGNSVPPRRPVDKENRNKESIKSDFRNNKERNRKDEREGEGEFLDEE